LHRFGQADMPAHFQLLTGDDLQGQDGRFLLARQRRTGDFPLFGLPVLQGHAVCVAKQGPPVVVCPHLCLCPENQAQRDDNAPQDGLALISALFFHGTRPQSKLQSIWPIFTLDCVKKDKFFLPVHEYVGLFRLNLAVQGVCHALPPTGWAAEHLFFVQEPACWRCGLCGDALTHHAAPQRQQGLALGSQGVGVDLGGFFVQTRAVLQAAHFAVSIGRVFAHA